MGIRRVRKTVVSTNVLYANQLVSPDQDFTYDALYRLVKSKGREQIADIWLAGMNDNWDDGAYKAPLGEDAAQNYTQRYSYDAAGNILELKHIAGVGSYTRSYGYGTSSNRLVSTEVGTSASSTVYTYGYDARGNMKTMPHLTAGWGLQNQMSDAVVGGVHTFYQYSSGERVRKYTDKGSVKEERIYLGSYEVYRKYDVSGNLDLERTTVHVSDDTGRVATLESRTVGTDSSPASLTRYIYSNHLQSATLELDDSGQVISYEEYHPYGTTAYQAMNASINAVAKRYRFSGKERDEESGLYYHGARYYAPWLGRWTAVDPLESDYAPLSPYNYCFNNPVNFTDGSGMGPEEETKPKTLFIDSQSGRLLGELPEYKDPEKLENYSLPDLKINLRAISKLDFDDYKDYPLDKMRDSIIVDRQKISQDLETAVKRHFGEGKTYKEQEVAIFFDNKTNKISSELLPDEPNKNHSSDIHSFLTLTRTSPYNGAEYKFTELVPNGSRPESYKDVSAEAISANAKGSELYLIAIAHTHPANEPGETSRPGDLSNVGGSTAGIRNSKPDLDLLMQTGLPDFIIDAHAVDDLSINPSCELV